MRARKLAVLVGAALTAAAWSLAPVGTAVAAAGITTTGVSLVSSPQPGLQVYGTATCSTTTGTATVYVSALQLMDTVIGSGTTTISCADQPAHWTVFAGPGSACTPFPNHTGCFRPNSVVNVFATLTRNGVQEAYQGGGFST
ncbi:hypothetical protein AB0G02_02515 [Actinosynnema sp. NPDC023658]|uniref:hypothetical protein n=1 Tax=Actinosynnema sp. NPDC023658 TaxID=3155465 RepID=UPI0033ED9EB7